MPFLVSFLRVTFRSKTPQDPRCHFRYSRHLHSSNQLHQQAMCFSDKDSKGTRWCTVRARQGNSSRHVPCSHSLPPALCWPGLVPQRVQSKVGRLHRLHNAGLPIATNTLQCASISHLCRESAMLSVFNSLSLTCRQYLAGSPRSIHHALYRSLLLRSQHHTKNPKD